MRAWAIFCYGVAVGIFTVWILDALSNPVGGNWLLVGAAGILVVGLVTHQRHVSLSRGRRWRKTISD